MKWTISWCSEKPSHQKEKDGKVFDRTKAAVRMFYNAGHLKTFNEGKTLIAATAELDEIDEDDPLVKTLISKGWKAPTKSKYQGYKKWFKCKHCRCSCEPPKLV